MLAAARFRVAFSAPFMGKLLDPQHPELPVAGAPVEKKLRQKNQAKWQSEEWKNFDFKAETFFSKLEARPANMVEVS